MDVLIECSGKTGVGSKSMRLSAIASALHLRLENGSPETEITGLNGVEQAGPGELTFVSNPKYAAATRSTKASAVIVSEDFPSIPVAMLRAKDPYLSFAKALELFHPPLPYPPGVHPTAVVHESAKIGAGAHIGPYVVIGERRRDRQGCRSAGSRGHLSGRQDWR